MVGKIQIPKGGIKLKGDAELVQLPINSKRFVYDCQEGDASCQTEEKKKGGGCSTVDVESDKSIRLILVFAFMAGAIALALGLRKKSL